MGLQSHDYYGEKVTPENIKPLTEKQVKVVVWWFWWDESKWTHAEVLAENGDYELLVSPIGWPNAWHTITLENGEKFVWRNLPGSAITGKDVFLGQGKYVNVELMEDELLRLKELWAEPKIKIAKWSHALFWSFHGRMDGSIEDAKKENGNNIGTTGSGMWPGVATRWLRSGITMERLEKMSLSDIAIAQKELIAPFNPDFIWSMDHIKHEMGYQQYRLKELIDQWRVQMVDDTYAQQAYIDWLKMLVEWAQSDPLGMFAGSYPNNTSTDTSFLWIMSSLLINPTLDRVWVDWILKIISSKVWIHQFLEQISKIYPELLLSEEEFARLTWEFWSMSGRMRQLWFFNVVRLVNDILNNPYIETIAIRKMDVLEQFGKTLWFKKLPVVTGYTKQGKPKLTRLPYDNKIIVDTIKKEIDEVVWNKRWTNMPFVLWHSPKASDSRIILPGT